MTSAERVGSAASASDDGRRSGGGRGERVRFVGGSACASVALFPTQTWSQIWFFFGPIYIYMTIELI